MAEEQAAQDASARGSLRALTSSSLAADPHSYKTHMVFLQQTQVPWLDPAVGTLHQQILSQAAQ